MRSIITACTLLICTFICAQTKQVHLTNAALNVVAWLNDEKNPDNLITDTDEGIILTKYLKAELVESSVFQSKIKSGVNFIVADTTVIKKVNGTFTLKCKDTLVTFNDNIRDDEEYRIYYYDGQIPRLNQYIVTATYYEDYDYIYVDKTSGSQTSFSGGVPYLSPSKKKLLVLYNEPYENSFSFTLYNVRKNKFTQIVSTKFKNWIPAIAAPDAPFWSKDGYFYCAVVAIEDKDNPEAGYQYLRIKIL